MSSSSKTDEKYKAELESKETAELIEIFLGLQAKFNDDVKVIQQVRRQTLENDKQMGEMEQELGLILDEKEYALSSAWPLPLTQDSQQDKWLLNRIKALEGKVKEATDRYDTLSSFAGNLILEGKLPSSFEFPSDVRQKIKKLEKEVATMRGLHNAARLSEITEDALAAYVTDVKEEANLISDNMNRLKKEQFQMEVTVKRKEKELADLLEELKKFGLIRSKSGGRVWKLVSREESLKKKRSQSPPEMETISDMEEVEEA